MPRYDDIDIEPTVLKQFRERREESATSELGALSWLWREVCPSMSRRQRARMAVALAIASEGDRNSIRGRIHVLLKGKGGTGKTTLKDWVKHVMPDAIGIGPDSSNAGLRYNANTGERGALSQADGGILCIEELDNFGRAEHDALYEAMSEGYFEVSKGQVKGAIPANIRVVAVANDLSEFAGPLLDRFDFIIDMDAYNADDTVEVTGALYDNFREGYVYDNLSHERPIYPQYLSWISSFRPEYPEGEHERIKRCLEHLVRDGNLVGDIREKEAYMRAAFVMAKLDQSPITAERWVRAVDLLHDDANIRRLMEPMLAAESDTTDDL